MRSSAPGASSTVRESTLDAIANAMRDGHVGLDQAGHDVDAGPLRGEHQVDAHGARLLGDLDDRVLDLAALAQDQVGQLVDDHDHVRHAACRSAAG